MTESTNPEYLAEACRKRGFILTKASDNEPMYRSGGYRIINDWGWPIVGERYDLSPEGVLKFLNYHDKQMNQSSVKVQRLPHGRK